MLLFTANGSVVIHANDAPNASVKQHKTGVVLFPWKPRRADKKLYNTLFVINSLVKHSLVATSDTSGTFWNLGLGVCMK